MLAANAFASESSNWTPSPKLKETSFFLSWKVHLTWINGPSLTNSKVKCSFFFYFGLASLSHVTFPQEGKGMLTLLQAGSWISHPSPNHHQMGQNHNKILKRWWGDNDVAEQGRGLGAKAGDLNAFPGIWIKLKGKEPILLRYPAAFPVHPTTYMYIYKHTHKY